MDWDHTGSSPKNGSLKVPTDPNKVWVEKNRFPDPSPRGEDETTTQTFKRFCEGSPPSRSHVVLTGSSSGQNWRRLLDLIFKNLQYNQVQLTKIQLSQRPSRRFSLRFWGWKPGLDLKEFLPVGFNEKINLLRSSKVFIFGASGSLEASGWIHHSPETQDLRHVSVFKAHVSCYVTVNSSCSTTESVRFGHTVPSLCWFRTTDELLKDSKGEEKAQHWGIVGTTSSCFKQGNVEETRLWCIIILTHSLYGPPTQRRRQYNTDNDNSLSILTWVM